MASRTLPLLYLNLGGEMMYVLDQRLVAQKVPGAKSAKVLDDIANTMFNRRFIEEIFLKHQPLHSKRMLRAMFDKLAHASIMRLNTQSMDKLYDLMVMAVKQQFLLCRDPKDIIMVTLNHLDALHDYARSQAAKENLEMTYDLLIQSYCGLTTAQLQAVRHAALNFLLDVKVRVSIFLQEGKQHQDGTFRFGANTKLYKGVSKPGMISYYDDQGGEVNHTSAFDPASEYTGPDPPGGIGFHETGHRGTSLGLNIYANSRMASATVMDHGVDTPGTSAAGGAAAAASSSSSYVVDPSRPASDESSSFLAKEELNLLAKLIGSSESSSSRDTFKLNLFDVGREKDASRGKASSASAADVPVAPPDKSTFKIDLKAKSRKGKEITEIMEELTVNDDNGGDGDDDLLALMDKAK